jgi:hypothetical protein
MAVPPETPATSVTGKRGAVEYRAEARHAAFGSSIQLGWWEGAELRTAAGLLKDISRCGAALLAEAAPSKGSSVMIRLNGARHTEWVESSIVEVTKNRWFRRVPRLVRVQFQEPCPYHVFQAALDVLIMDCHAPVEEWSVPGGHFAARSKDRNRSGSGGSRRSAISG